MREGTREYYEERILMVQLYIQKHLDDSLSLDDLAKVACFSPYHFHRIFGAMVGESVGEYIRRLRMERATQDLLYSDQSVTDIAFDAGYENHESFTRAFRAMFGVPPSKYKESCHNGSLKTRGKTYTLKVVEIEGEEMEIRIEKFKSMTVAFVRHAGPYEECGSAWEKLCSEEAVMRAVGKEGMAIGICYDNPDVTEPEKIRYDACLTVNDDFKPENGIRKQLIEGGDYSVLTHRGSYDGLAECYRWLFGKWLPESGRELSESAPSLEIYRNSPDKTPPEELVTDICLPLKSIGNLE